MNELPNHPPLALATFAGVGYLHQWLQSWVRSWGDEHFHILIKMPAIFADLFLSVLLYVVVRVFRGEVGGIAAAATYAFHPAVIYDSAVWGQTDGIYTLFVAAMLFAVAKRQWYLTGALTVLAVFSKPQAVVFLPLLFFISCREWHALFKVGFSAILAAMTLLLPFMGAMQEVIGVYTNAVGYYNHVSLGAYNFWWMFLGDRAWQIEDTTLLFGILSYRTAGFLLFTCVYACILLGLHRRLSKAYQLSERVVSILSAGALVALTFFLFNTQMHERYAFAFLALGLPVAFTGLTQAAAYFGVSLLILWNLLGVLPFTAIDQALYAELPTLDVLVACGMVFLFLLLVVQYFRVQTVSPSGSNSTSNCHTAS